MATQTPIAQLIKPDGGENFSIVTYNDNIDKIDASLGAKVKQSDVVNNLAQSAAGKVLDASQGKVLNDALTALDAKVTNELAATALNEDSSIWRMKTSAPTMENGYDALIQMKAKSASRLDVVVYCQTRETLVGEKSFQNPSVLGSHGSVTVKVADNELGRNAVSYTLIPANEVWGLENTKDEIHNNGTVIHKTAHIVLNSVQASSVTYLNEDSTYARFRIVGVLTGGKSVDRVTALSNKLNVLYQETGFTGEYISQGDQADPTNIVMCINKLRIANWSDSLGSSQKEGVFTSWLASASVEIVYELESPVEAVNFAGVPILATEWPDKLTPNDTFIDTADGLLMATYQITLAQDAADVGFGNDGETVDGKLNELGSAITEAEINALFV